MFFIPDVIDIQLFLETMNWLLISNSYPPHHIHLIISTSSYPPHHVHLIVSYHHIHLIVSTSSYHIIISTSSYPPHHIHLIISYHHIHLIVSTSSYHIIISTSSYPPHHIISSYQLLARIMNINQGICFFFMKFIRFYVFHVINNVFFVWLLPVMSFFPLLTHVFNVVREKVFLSDFHFLLPMLSLF